MDTNRPKSAILKRDALGRVTLPRAQREALLDEFERSGMKGKPFARMVGVNYATFADWIQKRRHARGDYLKAYAAAAASPTQPSALRLVEVTLPVAAAKPTLAASAELELHLPGGARLLLHDAREAELAALLLRYLNPQLSDSSC